MSKIRLDHRVQELFPELSKTLIQSLIMQGQVSIDPVFDVGKFQTNLTKPGVQVPPDILLKVDYNPPKFVSRAGFKLEKALEHFGIDPKGMIVLDAGLSTGGFTDCLLQAGAKKVYGIDVGYGQVHEKIRTDPRVDVRERVNLRYFDDPIKVDMVTLDLSFISVLKVMDVINRILKPEGKLVVLIKPQFEAAKHEVGRGGIIKDEAIHQAVIDKIQKGITDQGFQFHGVTDSPILGATGNKEFLAYFTKI